MSLLPKEDILSKEMESREGFEYTLREQNRILFNKMMKEYKREEYANAVNAKGKFYNDLFGWKIEKWPGIQVNKHILTSL